MSAPLPLRRHSRISAVCALLSACVLLAGCDSNDDTLWQPAPELVPYAVGNSWTFERQLFAGSAVVRSDSFEVRVVGKTTVEVEGRERDMFEIVHVLGGRPHPVRWYVGSEPAAITRMVGPRLRDPMRTARSSGVTLPSRAMSGRR